MWPFSAISKAIEKSAIRQAQEEGALIELNKKNEKIRESIRNFAQVGDCVEYLGVKMTVASNNYYGMYGYNPGLLLEWMDSLNHIQIVSISHDSLNMCKRLFQKSQAEQLHDLHPM